MSRIGEEKDAGERSPAFLNASMQSWIMGLLATGLGFALLLVFDNSRAIVGIQSDIKHDQAQGADRYTGSEATKRAAVVDKAMDRVRDRSDDGAAALWRKVSSLSERLARLEESKNCGGVSE